MTLKLNDNGLLCWEYENSELHRENAPAIISPGGHIQYHYKDKLHRLDGPAIIYSFGTKEYWIHGKYYSEEEYLTKVRSKVEEL